MDENQKSIGDLIPPAADVLIFGGDAEFAVWNGKTVEFVGHRFRAPICEPESPDTIFPNFIVKGL